MITKKKETYTANVKITAIVGVNVAGVNLQDAMEGAKAIDLDDAVTILGENIDYSVKLLGVSSDEWGVD